MADLPGKVAIMRKEYDFTKARRNPYAKLLKRPVTIRLDEPTIDYFRTLASEIEIPYQTLINLYLRDCAATQRKPALSWRPAPSRRGTT
jgi:predicted DNA binding CopG/RHH family protein